MVGFIWSYREYQVIASSDCCMNSGMTHIPPSVSHHSILGRIIRVTQEVDEYREWIRKNWGSPSQNDLPLNSMFKLLKFTKYFSKSQWNYNFTQIEVRERSRRRVKSYSSSLNLTWRELQLLQHAGFALDWVDLCIYICPLSVSVGNDVTLFESQQLDECNNNVPDDDDVVVVLPSTPHSKTSSNSSSPSPSLRSSPSSSPLSPSSTSSTSSSSDAVSHTYRASRYCTLGFICSTYSFLSITSWLQNILERQFSLFLGFPQDSDGTPCKTAKQQPGRGSSAHREKSAAVNNHRTQSHTTSTPSGSTKGGKVRSYIHLPHSMRHIIQE